MNRKIINRVEPTSLAQKIDSGVQLFGAMKGLYSVGKSVFEPIWLLLQNAKQTNNLHTFSFSTFFLATINMHYICSMTA